MEDWLKESVFDLITRLKALFEDEEMTKRCVAFMFHNHCDTTAEAEKVRKYLEFNIRMIYTLLNRSSRPAKLLQLVESIKFPFTYSIPEFTDDIKSTLFQTIQNRINTLNNRTEYTIRRLSANDYEELKNTAAALSRWIGVLRKFYDDGNNNNTPEKIEEINKLEGSLKEKFAPVLPYFEYWLIIPTMYTLKTPN